MQVGIAKQFQNARADVVGFLRNKPKKGSVIDGKLM